MVMADEARSYFESGEMTGQNDIDPIERVAFACESLKVTTRLMHIIAWLLSQRAWHRGEISDDDLADEKYRLGPAARSEGGLSAPFPFAARALIDASQELYERVARLQERIDRMLQPDPADRESPVRAMMDRLNRMF